jgi:hypothetical protein
VDHKYSWNIFDILYIRQSIMNTKDLYLVRIEFDLFITGKIIISEKIIRNGNLNGFLRFGRKTGEVSKKV